MNNELWLPEGSELLTSQGWLPIEECIDGSVYIMGPLGGKIQKQKIRSFSKAGGPNFKTQITRSSTGTSMMCFKKAYPIPKHQIFKSFLAHEEDLITSKINFSGALYHIDIPGEIIIVKCLSLIRIAPQDLEEDIFPQEDYEDGKTPSLTDCIMGNSLISAPSDYWFTRTKW